MHNTTGDLQRQVLHLLVHSFHPANLVHLGSELYEPNGSSFELKLVRITRRDRLRPCEVACGRDRIDGKARVDRVAFRNRDGIRSD